MIGETTYKTNYYATSKKSKSTCPNVSCRLIENSDTRASEFVLEAMDYDTLWKLYIYHILGVAYGGNPQEEVQLLKHIAIKSTIDTEEPSIWVYPGNIHNLFQELPNIPKKHIENILHWYTHNDLWDEYKDHCEALSILVQPIEVIYGGKGIYEYSYYDDGMLRSPMKVIYQATGNEHL